MSEMQEIVEGINRKANEYIIEKFPWLKPRSIITGNFIEDFDYEFTALSGLEIGWHKAFGFEMQEELKDALIETGDLDNYGVTQIKEKWGELCWYDYGGNDKTDAIVQKYSTLSKHICVGCGKPDVPQTLNGWIQPICKECFIERHPNLENAENAYEEATKGSSKEMETVGEYITWTKDGETASKFDYSDTAERIRQKWKNESAIYESSRDFLN